jgi:calcium permeable stress-gated cation channel
MIPKKLDDKIDALKAKVQGEDEGTVRKEKEDEEGEKAVEKAKEKEKDDKEKQENRGETTGIAPRPLEGAPELFRQLSTSKASKASSNKSKRSSKAPPAGVDLSDEDSSDEEDHFDEHAFDHPSTYVEQAWIWLPRDRLGLSEVLVEELKSHGVDASDAGATMDERGIVEVTRNPPDEEWSGGQDR